MAGNERLSYEIAAIYSGSPEIKKAFDDFARLNAQGQNVVKQLDRLGQASRKTGEAIRESRQGASQLGMQFNQLSTQIAGGTSPLLAFQQQLGDVGYALSFMGGPLGRIGTFLAGPWGAAIITATSVLTPFIAKLFQSSEAAKQAEQAYYDYLNAVRAGKRPELMKAEGELTQMLDERMKIMIKLDNASKQQGFNREFELQQVAKYKQRLEALNSKIAWQQQAVNQGNIAFGEEFKARERVTKSIDRQSSARTTLSKIDSMEDNARKIQRETEQYNNLAEKLQSIINIRTSETEEIGRAKNELVEFDKLIKEIAAATIGGNAVGAQFVMQLSSQIKTVRDQLVEATLGMQDYMVAIPPMSAAAEEAFKRQKDAIESVGISVNDAFKGMLTAGMSWKDGMKGIIQTVIDELWRMYVVQQIVGMVSGAINGLFGGTPGIGKAKPGTLEANFDNAFGLGGARAIGGSVLSNTPYLVGEKGPELFVPGGNGTIIPNRNMNSGGGMTPSINVTVDARGSADPAAVRAQVQQGILEAAPAIVAAAQQRTVSNLRRPKLGGAIQ